MARKSIGALAALLAFWVSGCATGYGARGLTGGYTDERIDDSHYVVRFNGNGYASADRVWYFWIYRCAELTKEKGFEYFAIEPVQKKVSRSASRGAGLFQPAAFHPGAPRGLPVEQAYYYTTTITTWNAGGIVAMYTEVPPREFLFSAQSILDQLAMYIKTNGYNDTPPDRVELLKTAAVFLGRDGTVRRAFPDAGSVPNAAPAADAPAPAGAADKS